mgnify:CR=1 FL=1
MDDEPEFVDTSATFLEREEDRITVDTSTSADEGLEMLRQRGYDCVVSDYDMPETDGIEFLRMVREIYPELPFVLFTGKGSEEVASEAISAGVTQYLRKRPGTQQYELLANRVIKAAEGHRAKKEVDWHKAIIRNMGEGVYVFDSDYVFRFVNYRTDIEELSEENWEGSPLSLLAEQDVLSSSEVESIKDGADRIFAGETDEVRVEIEPSLPEETRVAELRLTQLRVGTGDDLVLGLTRDITERKERERALSESEEKYSTLVENANAGVVITKNGKVAFANSSMGDIVDMDVQEKIGEDVWEFIAPERRETVKEWFESRIEGDEAPDSYETEIIDSEGEKIPVEVNVSVITYDGEKASMAVVHDITERKERERELQRYETFIENSSDIIVHLDEDGTMLYESPGTEEVFGHEPGLNLGENVFEYVHPEDRERVFEKLADALNDPETKTDSVELRLENADGEYVWMEATATDQTDTETGGVVVRLRDISDRKKRQRNLERKNERLEEFAGVVSHDLRNPLTVAKGRLELAQDDCESEQLDEVSDALDRMGRLIDDLLALAREDTQAKDVVSVELGDVVEDSWQNVETEDATLVTETEMSLRADRSRLKQMLENLIRNSVEHTPTGEVTVTVGELEDGFYVADDGQGIPEDERETVFESGYSTAEDGTGLGLSIVSDIARSHGWDVTVTESEDGGARFEVTGIEKDGD